MKKIKNILLIFTMILCATTVAYSADFNSQDSFTKDLNTLKDTFSEETPKESDDSVKTLVQKQQNKKNKINKKIDKKNKDDGSTTEIDIKSDTLDYFPERNEIEAVGKASITFPSDGSTLRADKLIFNQDTNILKGYGNVYLVKDSNIMEGDFITINFNEENALLDNALTENRLVKLHSEDAKVVAGKDLLFENGKANPKIDKTVLAGNASFSQFGMNQLNDAKRIFYMKENYNQKYTIKSKEIIIDARPEHDKLTIKSANVYLEGKRIGNFGTLEFITDKQQQYVETNTPELGFIREFGTYLGPGWAFEGPFGGSIKLVPLLSIYEGKVGGGGLVRYRNSKNMTEFAINSSKGSKAILRGEQKLTDDISVVYGMNAYMEEWFMGDRQPGKIAELAYDKSYNVDDLGINFRHRITVGIAEEYNKHWSTMRARWMGEANKPIWYYGDDVHDRYATLELSTQGSAAVYGTGDVLGLLRIGPRLRTETNRWIQTLGYYYTAQHGKTPFQFDQYMYGTNNVYITEGLKLNKYLSVMWSGSFALNKDAWDGKLVQENRFYVMVGPEDIKFTLGYDPVRQRTVFNCFMLLGTKNTDLDFKKLYIKQPDKLGVSESENRRAEKASLEAKAEIKPSFTDKLFNRTQEVNIEPEREEKLLLEEQPITNKVPEHEVIIPQVKGKKEIPATYSIKGSRFKSGSIRLHDETTTPMLTPMLLPNMMNQGL